jgi:hypothetical protein
MVWWVAGLEERRPRVIYAWHARLAADAAVAWCQIAAARCPRLEAPRGRG